MSAEECFIEIKVSPRASRNAIGGWHAGRLKVSVTAAPERGKANQAVVRLIARTLGLPGGAVSVVRGHLQRDKRLRIAAGADVLAVLPGHD